MPNIDLTTAIGVRFGNTDVAAVRVGDVDIWPSSPTPGPTDPVAHYSFDEVVVEGNEDGWDYGYSNDVSGWGNGPIRWVGEQVIEPPYIYIESEAGEAVASWDSESIPSITSTTAWTILGYAYVDPTGRPLQVDTDGGGDPRQLYFRAVGSTMQIFILHGDTYAPIASVNTTLDQFSDGMWALVRNGTMAHFFLNGVLLWSYAAWTSAPQSFANGDVSAYFAPYWGQTGRTQQADDVFIFNYAMTSAEMIAFLEGTTMAARRAPVA